MNSNFPSSGSSQKDEPESVPNRLLKLLQQDPPLPELLLNLETLPNTAPHSHILAITPPSIDHPFGSLIPEMILKKAGYIIHHTCSFSEESLQKQLTTHAPKIITFYSFLNTALPNFSKILPLFNKLTPHPPIHCGGFAFDEEIIEKFQKLYMGKIQKSPSTIKFCEIILKGANTPKI